MVAQGPGLALLSPLLSAFGFVVGSLEEHARDGDVLVGKGYEAFLEVARDRHMEPAFFGDRCRTAVATTTEASQSKLKSGKVSLSEQDAAQQYPQK